MDASLPLSSSSHSQETSPKSSSTRSGLTLVLPSLKNLQAAKVTKKSKRSSSFPNSPAFDVEVPEKKAPRPVKLKPLKEVLTKLIQQIKKKDDYAFFLEPVDPTQVPGYSDAIKRPMDLGTMTNKVNRGKYRSLEDFANDLKLVTTNAKTFNPPGTIYYTEADRIETWALDHIAKASATVIQYETDWNIDIEKDDDTAVNIDDDDDENLPTSIPPEDFPTNGRSASVTSQSQHLTGRRGPRGPYKKVAAPPTVSESIDNEGRLPGSKDGIGAFPPCSDWAKTMVALKLKGKRYKTKKERLRFEKEGPPYLPDGSLDYTEMEDPFSVLFALVPDRYSRPYLTPVYPSLSIPSPFHFPSTINLPFNYDPSLSIQLELPFTTTYSKRRHWHIIRNPIGRKGKDNAEEVEVDEPPWHVGREAHPVDFGSFAVLAGALSEEMKRRGVTTGIMKDSEEERAIFDVLRDSITTETTANGLSAPDDALTSGYLAGSDMSAKDYFTSQRAAEAEEYIRDVVYGGVDGFAYVRSLAEFVSSASQEGAFSPHSSLSQNIGMSLGVAAQNIVDELTEGRQSLLRETAEKLCLQLNEPSVKLATEYPLSKQIASSLHLNPKAVIALQALLQIRLQKIDMSALINKPEELFLSEEEWAGKSIKEKRKAMTEKADVVVRKRVRTRTEGETIEEEDTAMGVDGAGLFLSSTNPVSNLTNLEMEGPEELAEVLEYVADVLTELNRRVSGAGARLSVKEESSGTELQGGPSAPFKEPNGITCLNAEDPILRNLRLNLLALAKRAPLDTIARLPLELVPEHIRHYIPTLDTSVLASSTTSTGAETPVAVPMIPTATTPSSSS
ncbi:Bromodomain-containing protein 7 [Leucoagaricus sp. SymC.cos]|nr:Bromodomain-containing protein 7 [Leucoagaricus sp. SymC.cos]